MIDDDPILGAALANYPSNRARLLFIGGTALASLWIGITVLLLPVEASQAAAITISTLAIATLVVGWYIVHLWNREVVLYQRGFSYREGSRVAYILYAEVVSIRQRAEIVSHFGGLVRRKVFRCVVKTRQDETVVLSNLYKRIDELGVRLEQQINRALRPSVDGALARGERVSFSAVLKLSARGLHADGRDLPWEDFGGFRIQNRRLILLDKQGTEWFAVPLSEVDNITLLLDLLRRHESVDSL